MKEAGDKLTLWRDPAPCMRRLRKAPSMNNPHVWLISTLDSEKYRMYDEGLRHTVR